MEDGEDYGVNTFESHRQVVRNPVVCVSVAVRAMEP